MNVQCVHVVGIVGLRATVIFYLRAIGIVGLHAVVSCRLETSPCKGGAAEIFNIESNTCNISSFVQPCNFSSFVQPLSVGSNNPATVSLAADRVNHPSLHSRWPHSCSPHRHSRDVELVMLNM